jgi:hypothetical protein
MLQSIKNMLECFEKEQIIYCHFKSNEHLIDALNGDTDLDILFLPTQRAQLEKLLNSCGLKRFRATHHMQYNAIEDFIGFDKDTNKIWHLHLHYRLTLGEKHLKGYTTSWSEYILQNRVFDENLGIYHSRLEDEVFLLILRMALKLRWRDFGRKIGKDDIIEFNWLKERVDFKRVVLISKELLGEKCSREYNKIFNSDLKYKNDLFKLQRLLRSKMKHFTSNNVVSSYFKRLVREVFWLLSGVSRKIGLFTEVPKRRVSPSGGSVVAILGCDGAGKSTTLVYLKKEFGKKIDIKHVYLGSGDGSSSLIRMPMRLIAKRVGGKGLGSTVKHEIDNSNSKKLSTKARIYTLAKVMWACSLALEKRKKLRVITKARNNGILVLVDRYPQIEVMGYNDGPLLSKYIDGKSSLFKKLAEWEMSVYRSAYINPPDLVVKLIVPTEIAIKRKPEMTYSEIEAKKDAVQKIKLSSNTVEVDTSNDLKTSLSKVMENIWEVM